MSKQSFSKLIIKYIDYLALLLYSAVLLLDFSKYVFSNFDSSQPLFIAVRVLVLVVALFKLIHYFRSNPIFSISGFIILVAAFLFQYFKTHYLYGQYPRIETFFYAFPLLLGIFAIAIALYGINFELINIFFLITIGTSYVIRVTGAICRLLPMGIAIRDARGRPAYDFGFSQYNTAMVYYLFIALSWIYLVRNLKSRLYHYITIMVIGTILYYFTTSKTSFATLVVAVFFLILYTISPGSLYEKLKRKLLVPIRLIMAISPILSVTVSFVLTIVYNYAYKKYSKKFEGGTFWIRFKSTSIDFVKNGVHLPFEYYKLDKYKDESFNWLLGGAIKSQFSDNLWHYLFIINGIVVFLLLLGLLQLLAIKAYKNKDNVLLTIIAVLSLFSIMESCTYDIGKNGFLMLIYTSSSVLPLSIFSREHNRRLGRKRSRVPQADNSITYNPFKTFSFKNQLKHIINSLSSHATTVIVLVVAYLVITMITTASVIYQVVTYTVSAWFNIWMVCTVYLILIFYLIVRDSNNHATSDISLKRLLRKYGVQMGLSLIVLLIGCIFIMRYALDVTTYEIDTNDPALVDGVALDQYSYDQTFYCDKPGLSTISIYLEDYGPEYNPIPLALFDSKSTCGLAVQLSSADYTPGRPLTVDVQAVGYGSFKKDMVYQAHFYNTAGYGKKVPVLKKVVYTCYEDLPILACLYRALPFLMIINLIWIASSILTIVARSRRD